MCRQVAKGFDTMRANDTCIGWTQEILGKEVRRGSVTEVPRSIQEHPLSGEQWMKMTDKILFDCSGFSTTAHNQCICKSATSESTISILQQVDDFSIGITNKSAPERVAKQTGERVKFKHKEEPSITFLDLVEDCNGVDIKHFNDSISMSSKGHTKHMLKKCGWDTEDGEMGGHPVSPMPVDCLIQIHGEEGCTVSL